MASVVYVTSSTTQITAQTASVVDVNITEDITEVVVSNLQGPQGIPGTSGVISVVSPITNTGTSGEAIIGINASSADTANYVVRRDANGEFVTAAVTIDPTNTPTSAVGKLYWDGGGTVNLGLLGGNVSAALGENLFSYVTNAEATTLAIGEVVYVYGAQGNRISVKRASNSGESTSSKTLGIVAESIATNQSGFVITRGLIEKMTLGSYTEGAPVYLGSTAGTFTSTKPSAPNHLVSLGWVIRANNGNGQIYVNVQNGFELDELHDVSIVSKADGQFLIYDGPTSLWKNQAISATAPVTFNAATHTIAASAASTSASGVVQLSDSTSTTSSTLASTPTATKAAYDLANTANTTANAAVPKATFTTSGDLIQGTGAGTYARLGSGTTGQVLSTDGTSLSWITPQVGDITSVTATAPLSGGGTTGDVTVGLNIGSSLTTSASNLIVDSTVVPYLGTANTFTGGVQQITTASAATKGLIVQGVSGQTANLQEWPVTGGSVGTFTVDGAGRLINSGNARFILGTATILTGVIASINTNTATNIGVVIRGAASQAASLQEWQNSAAGVLIRVDSSGNLIGGSSAAVRIRYVTNLNGTVGTYVDNEVVANTMSIIQRTTTAVGVIVKGAASQTADLQQWQTSAGVVVANMTSSGRFRAAPLGTTSDLVMISEENSGGYVRLTKQTATAANISSGQGKLYFRDGTTAGTLKLVVIAGAAGAETTILDNIPQ